MKPDPIAEWVALGMRIGARDEKPAAEAIVTNPKILAEELAEIRRRHEADAAELERYRESLRAEILANSRAEELVDKLADALERAKVELNALLPYGKKATLEVLVAIEAALRLAGRLP